MIRMCVHLVLNECIRHKVLLTAKDLDPALSKLGKCARKRNLDFFVHSLNRQAEKVSCMPKEGTDVKTHLAANTQACGRRID